MEAKEAKEKAKDTFTIKKFSFNKVKVILKPFKKVQDLQFFDHQRSPILKHKQLETYFSALSFRGVRLVNSSELQLNL